jgi:uncharacterized protein
VSEPRLPTRAQSLNFLVEAGCSKGVIDHCKMVSRVSVSIAKAFVNKGFDVDVKLVEVSSLLHDIGRCKTHTVDHGIVGGQIARSLGLSRSIVRIIERHVGGGVPKDEARMLGWPPRDYLPRTLEEKIVCYADKRVEGLKTVPIERALKPYVASLGENHPAVMRIEKLHEEIVTAVGDPL